MNVIAKLGRRDLATVYIASMGNEKYVEFVESLQPPLLKNEKWVLIVSTLFGCPVGCQICDAGGWYKGRLTHEEIFQQISFLIDKSFPDKTVPVKKFKIQFARMGEPAFNSNILTVISELPKKYEMPGFIPSISTIAPAGTDPFFTDLLRLRHEQFKERPFQLQFSIHSTDQQQRDRLIPVKKWDFFKISSYGKQFFLPGSRKITLNFALAEDTLLDHDKIEKNFPKEIFLIKLTPVNPTVSALKNNIRNDLSSTSLGNHKKEIETLKKMGYQVIISIGELEENRIGSNCGQYVKNFYDGGMKGWSESYNYSFTTP